MTKALPRPLAIARHAHRRCRACGRSARAMGPGARRRRYRAALRRGLRISEALGLKATTAARRERRHSSRQGRQAAHRPGAAAGRATHRRLVALCPFDLPADGPLFVGAKGGPLSPRIVQLAMERLRGALGLPDSATPQRCGILRDASAGARRRPARHPGTAGSRLAVDHADLHGGGRRAPA